jgi:hypothetical protein
MIYGRVHYDETNEAYSYRSGFVNPDYATGAGVPLVERHYVHAMHISRAIIITAIVALVGCSRTSPVVTIANRSTNALANVVLSGSGFTNRIDSIAAGAQSSLTVRPRGESGVRIAFDAGGQHIDSGEQGYFEAGGGYRVAITVAPDLKVSVLADIGSR